MNALVLLKRVFEKWADGIILWMHGVYNIYIEYIV